MAFTSIKKVLEKKSGNVDLRGWIKRKREISGNIFFILRDASGVVQCVVEKAAVTPKIWQDAQKAMVESSIELKGALKADDRAPGGVELRIKGLKVVSFSEDFPIGRDLSEEFLLDVRHLWLRSQKLGAAMKVKSSAMRYLRDFMVEESYTEIQNPSFVSGAVEGGSTLFEVPYFGKKVFLSQSGQFYNEAYIYAFEKVYGFAPSFRAEKSRTRRHLTEYWHFEWETAWSDFKHLLDFEEKMLKYVCKRVLEDHQEELQSLGRNPKDLAPVVKKKFPRHTYDEVLKMAQKKFPKIKWGSDLGEKEEREVTKDFNLPIIVTHYPTKFKPFYHRPDPDNPEVVLCADVLAPEGYGEIIGSGERCWTVEELTSRLKASGLKPELYQWYVDLRKYGSVPHTGGGLGLERTVAWLCKLPHIRDVIGFPRTMNRTQP
jgi:asparaginyl-tRNA synthetase